jgi:hypothetical protein
MAGTIFPQRHSIGFQARDGYAISFVSSNNNLPGIARRTFSQGLLFRDRKMIKDGDDNVSLVVSLGRCLSITQCPPSSERVAPLAL